jgi:hypothetical protein
VFGPLLLALVDETFEIRCNTDHSGIIMQELLTGETDVGFILKCPAIAGIQLELLYRSPIIAVACATHPLAGRQGLTLQDIANERLAPQQWGTGCDELILQLRLLRQVASPLHAIQPASAARELALEHGFITLMPALAITRDLEFGRLVKLDVVDLPPDHWDVMMAWRSDSAPIPPRSGCWRRPVPLPGAGRASGHKKAPDQAGALRYSLDARSDSVAGLEGDAGEGAEPAQLHVPGPRLGGVQGTGFGIAALVGAAVIAAGGRRAAELHVEIRIPAAAAAGHHQLASAGGHLDGEVQLAPLAAVRLLTGTPFCSTLPGWGVVPPQVALTPTAVKAAATSLTL